MKNLVCATIPFYILEKTRVWHGIHLIYHEIFQYRRGLRQGNFNIKAKTTADICCEDPRMPPRYTA